MTVPADILELWQGHSSSAFPSGFGNRVIGGIDLPLLDAEIGGCIRMYIHADGLLDRKQARILHERLIDLNSIILLLESEELMYFNRLINLANLILQQVEG
jgi:hypothetical protein